MAAGPRSQLLGSGHARGTRAPAIERVEASPTKAHLHRRNPTAPQGDRGRPRRGPYRSNRAAGAARPRRAPQGIRAKVLWCRFLACVCPRHPKGAVGAATQLQLPASGLWVTDAVAVFCIVMDTRWPRPSATVPLPQAATHAPERLSAIRSPTQGQDGPAQVTAPRWRATGRRRSWGCRGRCCW